MKHADRHNSEKSFDIILMPSETNSIKLTGHGIYVNEKELCVLTASEFLNGSTVLVNFKIFKGKIDFMLLGEIKNTLRSLGHKGYYETKIRFSFMSDTGRELLRTFILEIERQDVPEEYAEAQDDIHKPWAMTESEKKTSDIKFLIFLALIILYGLIIFGFFYTIFYFLNKEAKF